MPNLTFYLMTQNYKTMSLVSHPSKVMLRVIHNGLKAKAEELPAEEQAEELPAEEPAEELLAEEPAEELLAEEQACFRAGRSTMEQIFNCRVLIEKHLQLQRDLFHNFNDFKEAFDRMWRLARPQKLQHRGRAHSSHPSPL